MELKNQRRSLMKKTFLAVASILYIAILGLSAGCTPTGGGASAKANAQADQMMYKEVVYANANMKGPQLIVLPGQIKSNNATFLHHITVNNIADFGELELMNANFGVLERTDLGPLLDEISLGVNMGDPTALQKFKRGKFKSTKWFVKFDILKAEKVAAASQGFDGRAIGSILGAVMGGTGGSVTDTAVSSARTADAAGVWIIGMRYKVLDASTSEQVSTGYFEDKMEVGAKGGSFMGIQQSQEKTMTLDTMVQRLVQKAVMKIDSQK